MADQLEPYNLEEERWYQDISDVQELLDKPEDYVAAMEQKPNIWEEIEKFLTTYGLENLTCELIKGIKVRGRPLENYFAKLDELMTVINLLRSINGVATDVIGILCLIASMGNDLTNVLKGKDVEKSWQDFIKKERQVTTQAKQSYAKHGNKYMCIFNCIFAIIKAAYPRAGLCVRIAAFLFTVVWPQREYLASWIIDSWKLKSGTPDWPIVSAARRSVPDNIDVNVVAIVVVVVGALLVGMLVNRLTY